MLGSSSLQSVASGAKKVNGASISGKGSEVINTTSVCDYKYIDVTHNGSSNLAVWGISPKGTYPEDLLINEIGNYTGTVRLPQYIELLVIEADGSWQIIFTK